MKQIAINSFYLLCITPTIDEEFHLLQFLINWELIVECKKCLSNFDFELRQSLNNYLFDIF